MKTLCFLYIDFKTDILTWTDKPVSFFCFNLLTIFLLGQDFSQYNPL